MSNYAIKVENLGKKYRLIDAASQAVKLDNLWDYIALPWRRFKEIQSLTSFSENDEDKIFWALQDINFELKHGEVLGIIGRNGAGKSTLLKILSKITSPSTGRVEINGRVNSLLEVGTGFNDSLTGRENIYMNGTIHGMSKKEIDAKIEEIADFAGLGEGFLDIPVKRYSSGMKVRLGFAVAAHLEPEILIVDEVLAVGDAQFKRKCMGKMGEVTGQGRTVILVSHSLENIEQLCDRTIMLEDGKIAKDGDTDSVIKHYLSGFRTNNSIPLIDRKDRIGDGRYKFSEVELYDKNMELTNVAKTGEDLNIVIKIKEISEEVINANFSLKVHLTNGIVLFACASRFQEKSILLDGDITIKIRLPKLQLTSGDYIISLSLTEGLVGYGTVKIDRLIEALEFSVSGGDYYNTKQVSRQSIFHVDYELDVHHSSDQKFIRSK